MHNSFFFEAHLEGLYGLHHLRLNIAFIFSSAAKATYISLVEAIYSSPACDSSERGSTNHCLDSGIKVKTSRQDCKSPALFFQIRKIDPTPMNQLVDFSFQQILLISKYRVADKPGDTIATNKGPCRNTWQQ